MNLLLLMVLGVPSQGMRIHPFGPFPICSNFSLGCALWGSAIPIKTSFLKQCYASPYCSAESLFSSGRGISGSQFGRWLTTALVPITKDYTRETKNLRTLWTKVSFPCQFKL